MALQVNRYPLPLLQAAVDGQVPCSRTGCPVGTDIPAMIAAITSGDHEAAYRLARASNPLASSCGHGCHAPCETACRRGKFGAPVAISSLEAFAAGYSTPASAAGSGPCTSAHDLRSVAGAVGRLPEEALRAPRSATIAIVGGGAAGLACAHDLALLGHRSVVLDAGHEPGGVLTRILPASRFPVAAAHAECLAILAGHVDYRPGFTLRDRFALNGLFARGFSAVFLAIGCWESRSDPRLAGALDAMAVLADDHSVDGDVVVIGDGDLALDAAREVASRARAAGNSQRTDLVLTARVEESAAPTHALAAAIREGVTVHNGWLLSRLCRDGSECVTGVEITRDGGRTSRILPCSHVIEAAPQRPAAHLLGVELNGTGYIKVDAETLRTSRPGVWAGGACVFGHRSIADAVADGKRAAWQIHASLCAKPIRIVVASAWVEADDHPTTSVARSLATRRVMNPSTVPVPADPFSHGSQPAAEAAASEAARCFDCTVVPVVSEACTACGKCVRACPTQAIRLGGEPALAIVDNDRCTRCGDCEDVCPEGAIVLARAVWEERLQFGDAPAGVKAPANAYPAELERVDLS